jgi:uncharacterized protein with HEPN domain
MSKHNDSVYLRHMVDAAQKVSSLVARGGRELYDADFAIADAMVRELLVIGEAARNVSIQYRESHRELPWKDIIGMRDWLVHGYAEIDWDKVWNTAVGDIPTLLTSLTTLVSEEAA